MSREYVIYTDESARSGKLYGNFYGGVLVRSVDVERINAGLRVRAQSLGLTGEVKWQKVSSAYLPRYVALVDAFFDHIAAGRAKVRVMFTRTRHTPGARDAEAAENEYHMLYFHFLKHAFGLQLSNPSHRPVSLRIYLDQLPDTRERNARFKGSVAALEKSPEFRRARIRVPADQIAEVRSHDHILLQCLDVVLGAMQFRLNEMHREKPPGKRTRGKRTIAKERLYHHIRRRITAIDPRFDIRITTPAAESAFGRWHQPYLHWLLDPGKHE